MSASLRPFRVLFFAAVVLLALAPHAASAHIKGFGTLIEYAGNSNIPHHIKMLLNQAMSIIGSGL